jgi:uncharacterized protein
VGYSGKELVAWGEPREVVGRTFAAVAQGCEVLTCISGAEAPLGDEDVAAATPEGVELDLHAGDQPAWWWLLCAE